MQGSRENVGNEVRAVKEGILKLQMSQWNI